MIIVFRTLYINSFLSHNNKIILKIDDMNHELDDYETAEKKIYRFNLKTNYTRI